jgi:hypothetical protein
MWSSGPLHQSRRTLIEGAFDELGAGLPAHPVAGAKLRERKRLTKVGDVPTLPQCG